MLTGVRECIKNEKRNIAEYLVKLKLEVLQHAANPEWFNKNGLDCIHDSDQEQRMRDKKPTLHGIT